jgi:hypothetical protein
VADCGHTPSGRPSLVVHPSRNCQSNPNPSSEQQKEMSETSTTPVVNELKRSREETETEQEPEAKKPKTFGDVLGDLDIQAIIGFAKDAKGEDTPEIAELRHVLNATRLRKIKNDVAIFRKSIKVINYFDEDCEKVEITASGEYLTYGELVDRICEADEKMRIPFSKLESTKDWWSDHVRAVFFEDMYEDDTEEGVFMFRWGT